MIDMDEAWQRIAALATALPEQRCDLERARGRVLTRDVISTIDLPPFDNSSMDGFAVRSADTEIASGTAPVRLELGATIAAGDSTTAPLRAGTAQPIMTGAPIPAGADAVLQLELAIQHEQFVELHAPVAPGRFVRARGQDIARGSVLARRGSAVTTNVAALLASAGVTTLPAHRQARAAMLTTGAELVAASSGIDLQPGQIYDANGPTMCALVRGAGCHVDDLGIVGDDPNVIRERIRGALDHDLVLISGGVSVGRYDHVKDVLAELGMERIFWRVRMKPGKPLLCGRIGSTWIFGLPGNPVSCIAGFAAFVEPLIRILQGGAATGPVYERARLRAPFVDQSDRRVLATAWIEPDQSGMLTVTPTRQQGSAMLHALAQSNGFLVVPEATRALEPDTMVDVLRLH